MFSSRVKASIRSSGEVSNPFIVYNGTKHDCVPAPLLFTLYFSIILETAFEYLKEGVRFDFRAISGLFNQHRFKTRTKTLVKSVRGLHLQTISRSSPTPFYSAVLREKS